MKLKASKLNLMPTTLVRDLMQVDVPTCRLTARRGKR